MNLKCYMVNKVIVDALSFQDYPCGEIKAYSMRIDKYRHKSGFLIASSNARQVERNRTL
jgi:hypothetical protein